MLRALRLPALLMAALPCVGCAVRPAVLPSFELRSIEQRAVAALAEGAYDHARADLLWLASRCDAGEHRMRALLLLAAVDLDPMNPVGSARAAAVASGAYIRSAEASPDRLPVARALFRLAADRGALDPRSEGDASVALMELAVACPGTPFPRDLPSVPPTSAPQRMSTLAAAISSQSDSLTAATARVRELEAELQRIRSILRDDLTPLSIMKAPQ